MNWLKRLFTPQGAKLPAPRSAPATTPQSRPPQASDLSDFDLTRQAIARMMFEKFESQGEASMSGPGWKAAISRAEDGDFWTGIWFADSRDAENSYRLQATVSVITGELGDRLSKDDALLVFMYAQRGALFVEPNTLDGRGGVIARILTPIRLKMEA